MPRARPAHGAAASLSRSLHQGDAAGAAAQGERPLSRPALPRHGKRGRGFRGRPGPGVPGALGTRWDPLGRGLWGRVGAGITRSRQGCQGFVRTRRAGDAEGCGNPVGRCASGLRGTAGFRLTAPRWLCPQSQPDGEPLPGALEKEDARSAPSTPSTPSVCSPPSSSSSTPSAGKNVCSSCGLEILDRYLLKVSGAEGDGGGGGLRVAPGLSPFSAAGEQPHLARPVPGVLRVPHLAAPAAQLLHQEQGDLLQDGLLQVGTGLGPLRGTRPSPGSAGSGPHRRCRGEGLENPPDSLEQPGGRRPSANGEKGRKGVWGATAQPPGGIPAPWPGCAGRPSPCSSRLRGCGVAGMAPWGKPGLEQPRPGSCRRGNGCCQPAVPSGLRGSPVRAVGPQWPERPRRERVMERERTAGSGCGRRGSAAAPGLGPDPHARGTLFHREDVLASTVFLF